MRLQEVLILVNQPIEDANDAMFPFVVLLYFSFHKAVRKHPVRTGKTTMADYKKEKRGCLTSACSTFEALGNLCNKQTEKHPRKEYIVHP